MDRILIAHVTNAARFAESFTRNGSLHVRWQVRDEYPDLVRQGFGPIEFEQAPGEIVFVPESW